MFSILIQFLTKSEKNVIATVIRDGYFAYSVFDNTPGFIVLQRSLMSRIKQTDI